MPHTPGAPPGGAAPISEPYTETQRLVLRDKVREFLESDGGPTGEALTPLDIVGVRNAKEALLQARLLFRAVGAAPRILPVGGPPSERLSASHTDGAVADTVADEDGVGELEVSQDKPSRFPARVRAHGQTRVCLRKKRETGHHVLLPAPPPSPRHLPLTGRPWFRRVGARTQWGWRRRTRGPWHRWQPWCRRRGRTQAALRREHGLGLPAGQGQRTSTGAGSAGGKARRLKAARNHLHALSSLPSSPTPSTPLLTNPTDACLHSAHNPLSADAGLSSPVAARHAYQAPAGQQEAFDAFTAGPGAEVSALLQANRESLKAKKEEAKSLAQKINAIKRGARGRARKRGLFCWKIQAPPTCTIMHFCQLGSL